MTRQEAGPGRWCSCWRWPCRCSGWRRTSLGRWPSRTSWVGPPADRSHRPPGEQVGEPALPGACRDESDAVRCAGFRAWRARLGRMAEIVLMGDARVARVPVRDCGDPLVDAREAPELTVAVHEDPGSPAYPFLRGMVVERLRAAQASLPAGLRLLLL